MGIIFLYHLYNAHKNHGCTLYTVKYGKWIIESVSVIFDWISSFWVQTYKSLPFSVVLSTLSDAGYSFKSENNLLCC